MHPARVAIVMRNRPEYMEAMYSGWHAGLVVVPVNARLHRDEIAYILEHSGTAVVLTDPDHADDVNSPAGFAASATPRRLADRLGLPVLTRRSVHMGKSRHNGNASCVPRG